MINFKTETIKREWESNKLDQRLKIMTLAIAEKMMQDYNCVMLITSIFRKGDPGVHGQWRGVDIRTHNLQIGEAEELTDWINRNFIYDESRPSLKSAVYHTVSGESGLHIHLQTCYSKSSSWR